MLILIYFFRQLSFPIEKVDVWFTNLLIYSFNTNYEPGTFLGIVFKEAKRILEIQSLYFSD